MWIGIFFLPHVFLRLVGEDQVLLAVGGRRVEPHELVVEVEHPYHRRPRRQPVRAVRDEHAYDSAGSTAAKTRGA